MKRPRLKYTYVFFYQCFIDDRAGVGMFQFDTNERVKTLDRIAAIEKALKNRDNFEWCAVTDFKLLSIRIVWE